MKKRHDCVILFLQKRGKKGRHIWRKCAENGPLLFRKKEPFSGEDWRTIKRVSSIGKKNKVFGGDRGETFLWKDNGTGV